MLTRCPQCFAWFRVRAEHLSVANGLVTCGRCEHVFNALTSLLEERAASETRLPPRVEMPTVPAIPTTASASATSAPEAQHEMPPAAPALPLTFVAVAATPGVTPPRSATTNAVVTTAAASSNAEAPRARSAAPLAFVAIAATPTVTPPRPSASESVVTTAAAASVAAMNYTKEIRATSPPALEEDAQEIVPGDGRAAREDRPLPCEPLDEQVELAAAEENAGKLDDGPVSSARDALDISDFDFSDVDDEDLAPPASLAEDQALRENSEPDALAAHEASRDGALPLILRNVEDTLAHRISADQIDDSDDDDITDSQAVVPALLRDELAALVAAPRPPLWRHIAWILFGLSLALLAALQVVFIERQRVLAEWPASAPLIDRLCERLPCLERREAASAVRLLARDVREHPTYRDALLVNATIVNAAHTPSPYPVIDLRLRDAAGNVLSARRFEPREYLDQSIAIADGMPSDRPVYIVLELAGNASNAVSFEFTFL